MLAESAEQSLLRASKNTPASEATTPSQALRAAVVLCGLSCMLVVFGRPHTSRHQQGQFYTAVACVQADP
eukprot:8340628-Alexandrium_andersonii.AAC.1